MTDLCYLVHSQDVENKGSYSVVGKKFAGYAAMAGKPQPVQTVSVAIDAESGEPFYFTSMSPDRSSFREDAQFFGPVNRDKLVYLENHYGVCELNEILGSLLNKELTFEELEKVKKTYDNVNEMKKTIETTYQTKREQRAALREAIHNPTVRPATEIATGVKAPVLIS